MSIMVRICQTEDNQLRLLTAFSREKDLIMVPQGTVIGPILFVLCIQPLSNRIKRHYLSVHLFADDSQIKTSVFPQHFLSAISSVETCISDVKY